MGLVRVAARTAVISGTATAVSGRVAQRQALQYNEKVQAQQASAPAAAPAAMPSAAPPAAAAVRGDLLEVTAPMVGTFYRASAPGEPAFVELGSRISAGQPICILEAMKLMNELEAEVSGEVVEILVENGTPVEFGQVLMRVRPV